MPEQERVKGEKMKNRNGFVSNSSSSSYIVKIHATPDEFVDFLEAGGHKWDYFNLDNIKNKIDFQIKELEESRKKSLEEYKDRSECLSKFYDSRLTLLNEFKKEAGALTEENFDATVALVLKYNDITYGLEEDSVADSEENIVTLSYFTSMHNDFNDGMNDLLKEIVLSFLFDTNYKVECKREGDDYEDTKRIC